MRLSGKSVVVTGASRGLGRAIAIACAAEGAAVAVTYERQADAAAAVVAEIAGLGGTAMAVPLDVRQRPGVRAAFAAVRETLGGIDVLINNAGINKPTDFEDITDEDWDAVLAVNLRGVFVCCQEVLGHLRERGGGAIVNVSSVSGEYGGPRTAHYAASKAGVIALSQCLARRAARDGIRVNVLSPGLIASEMAARGLAGLGTLADGILVGRLGRAEEVARAAVFLASEDASYVTAETLRVNGGLYF
jgi:3-oxoacyl-[acyl-carrier protein] reductase